MSANGEFVPGIEELGPNGLTGDVKNDRQYLIPGSLYKKYTEGPQPEDEPEKPKEIPQKIGFLELLRFADKLDYVMLTAGVIGAIGNGVSWPFMIILFSTVVEDFVNQGKYENLLDKLSFVLDLFNISKEDARKDIDIFKPFCDVLTNYTYRGDKIDCSFMDDADNVFDSMHDSALQYVFGGIAIAICGFCQIYMFILSSERQIIKMRLAFYQNILRQEMAWFDHHSAGELAVKLTDDITKIHEAIGDKAATSIQYFAGAIAGFAVCFFYGWELALVLQLATPMLCMSLACASYFFTTITKKERKAYSKAGMVAEEVFSSMRTVHAFGGQEKEAQRYLRNLADASKFGSRKSLISGFSQGAMWLIIFCDWGLGLWYGGRLVRHGDYSVSDMMTVFFSAFIGCFSLGLAAPAFVIVNAGRGAAFSVYQILDRKSEIDSSSSVGLQPSSMTGRIQFKAVHFSYPARSSVKILNGIDITVNQGQTVALVGSSGCGKSTLIQLLLRFYDTDMGKVCLDGVDIRDINIKWLRQNIGHVGQEPVLFATSILENIRYGREGATMEEVVQACKDANAYDFIMKMPEKFETHVGERGAQLSGGQKQRIAIARALVKNPKVLLLDEATSALDNASEALVQDALDRASKGRTTVVIAHRLSTIRQADVIIALDKGKVSERGTHDELMSKQGLYFHLVSHQMRQKELESQSGSESDGGMAQIKLADETVLLAKGAVDYGRQKSLVIGGDDDLDLSASTKQTVKRLLKMNSTEWHYIVMGSMASFINGALQPAWSVVLSEMIKSFAEDDHDDQKDTARDMSLFSVGLGFASLVTYFVQDYMFGLAGETLTLRMREMLFRTIIRQNIGWFDDPRHETGVLTTQLAVETSVVQGAVKTLVGCMWLSFGNLGTGFVISLIFGWQLALVLMGFVPFIVTAGLLSVKYLGGAANESKTAMEDASTNALSCIDNIRTVAALTREETFLAKFGLSLWEPFKNNVKSSIVAAGAFGFSFGIYYIAFAVCFYYGSQLLKDDDIDFNNIFKVFGCVILGAMQFGRSVAFAPDANAAIKAARRIFALHDRTPPIDPYSEAGVRPPPDFKSTVRFSDAFFRYPMRPGAMVLNGINLSVEPGQTLALVGESGCGKSTTIQLIERFYDPDRGSVFLDKYDIKELNLQWLRAQIGLVSQEPILFDTSVAENIAYGDNTREVPMDDVIKAAKAANIHTFIQSLPQGYETNVGSKGTQFSGGQKQRVAIARALLKNPKILLLDEATSALDTDSEKIVQDALDKAREGRTCITIAHRLSTIKDADKIAVFKGGVVQEIGTHAQLMSKRGLYHRLVMTQSGKQS